MEHFTYFSEIEEHFQRRRGSILICSPLDWALMETWKEAGIPLEAVLRGIDAAFDKYERRAKKTRKVNSLAYCQQEVLAAVEELKEAAIGSKRDPRRPPSQTQPSGRYFERNAQQLAAASIRRRPCGRCRRSRRRPCGSWPHELRQQRRLRPIWKRWSGA